MTTVRIRQSDTDGIADVIESGHNFNGSALTGCRSNGKYVLKSYDEPIAVLDMDARTATLTTREWSLSTSKHQTYARRILQAMHLDFIETPKRLSMSGESY